MSGIYNQPSIYKQGSGGGYKDGGALVDGDFIKVENNSVSTYTNTSRNDINYYFEIQDGEVLNAVIELTNEYNATIHVYLVQNGLFIPLGNVGGDTVNAGDDYKINIVGNSFMLEVVMPSQAEPEAAYIGNSIYPIVKIGSLYWTTEYLHEPIGSNYNFISDGSDDQNAGRVLDKQYERITTRGRTYYRVSPVNSSYPINVIEEINALSEFRVPTLSDFDKIKNYTPNELLDTTDGGLNTTGFSAKITGYCQGAWSGPPYQLQYHKKYSGDTVSFFWLNDDRRASRIIYEILNIPIANYTVVTDGDSSNTVYLPVRLCKDV